MMSSLLLMTLVSMGPLPTTPSQASGKLVPGQLRCEAMVNPVGIGTASPRLSWRPTATGAKAFNLSQTKYRILVASRVDRLNPDKADLWDTGLVTSAETTDILYRGKPLGSNRAAFWRVQIVDQGGKASPWSAPAQFSTGLLKPSDWKAQWIGYDAPLAKFEKGDAWSAASWIWSQTPAEIGPMYFQRQFEVERGLVKAVAHMTADDQFTLSLNLIKAAESDGKTDAWRRPVTADVTKLLSEGTNVIAVRASNTEGEAAALIGSLTLQYDDGRTVQIVTNGTWSSSRTDRAERSAARVLGAYGMSPWGKFSAAGLKLPAPRLLRREFGVVKKVQRATLYGSALGLIELHLNGSPVSDELFVPGWTDYVKRVYARAYDVTSRIRPGQNALGAILGDGWYAGYVGFGGIREHYGAKIRAKVQLEIEYTDGTKATVASGPDWQASTGPTLEADFLMGEAYDARQEIPGWSKPGFTAKWKPVDTGAEMNPAVEAFPGQPVRPFAELRAKTITEPTKGAYVLNLGQNIAGYARLRVEGTKGQKITLRFAERLSPDGNIYTTNLRGARTIDTYTCRGGGVETWEPRFTFHGFQYIEVTGLGRKPKPDEVVAIAVSSDTPTVGKIETSDRMINQLVSNAWWTQRMNFIDVPTDCPQRDERLGWTGDAQAYVRTATMLTDVEPFFDKWLVTLDDAQRADGQFPMVAPVKVAGDDGGPAWADAGVICPWTIYDVYGNEALLRRHYPQMKKFVDFCQKRSTPKLLPPAQFHCFGDWLNINSPTPNEVIYTAYFAGSARILSQAAGRLGNRADEAKYRDLYEKIRSAFQDAYVSPDGRVRGESQCAYVLALGFDLLDEARVPLASKLLVADIEKRGWHLSTGFVGTRDIMHVLSKIGRNDVAFRLLHNKTFPSWGFTIVNGATSIWERWDGWTPDKGFQDAGMNSFSHYAFGAVVGWVMAQPAGIQNLEPGFRVVKVAPQIDPNLKWLRASYDSVRGLVRSEWKVQGSKLTLRVVVPPNVRAEIHVPATSVVAPAEAGSGSAAGKVTIYRVGSGDYTFVGSR